MVTSILHEIKKFINNPQQITLEFTFVDFESSVYKGIRTIKNLSTKRNDFTVVLVKNKTLGSVSFFFRDGPTYQFALTLEEANLYNDNNSNEYLINKFIVWDNDPIRGSQLKINSNYIIIYASIHDGNPRGLDSLGFNQIYSNCISVKSYNYALEIETLKKPTYQEPKNVISNIATNNGNLYRRIGILLLVIISLWLLSNFSRENQNTNVISGEFESDIVSIDTTVSASEISEFWIEKKYQNFSYSIPESMKLIENQSNENLQVIVDEDNNIGITISHSILPDGQENETISSLINGESRQFALSTNEENRRNFSDFQLIDYNFQMLGNLESFLVTQSSTELSGKNINMILESYFVISSPNYYSISLSYPENSISKKDVIKRIVNSFKFNITEIVGKISKQNNLEFLISTNGIYPKDINLLEDSTLRKRLKDLIGSGYNFLLNNWNVENPIVVKNNIFVAFGCQSHNCDSTNFIIIMDFSKNVLYCGIRENNNVKSFSEDGSNIQKLNDFVLGNL